MKTIDVSDNIEPSQTLIKFVPIDSIVEESVCNLKKDLDERLLLITWTDNYEEALEIVSELNNTYTFLWCTPHKSFEHFKKGFIEKEKLEEYNNEDLYDFPEIEYLTWDAPAGFKPPEGSMFK